MKKLILSFILIITTIFSFGQVANETDTLRKDALRVYMESDDFIRQEIPYINYVRDIKDAQVYIISSNQRTGSGGKEYTYYLVGQHEFKGMTDTLQFVSSPDNTEDQIRELGVNTLKQGLMRYVQTTPLAKHIRISFDQPMSQEVTTDNWDSWVFRTSVNGFLNGQ
ncbi:MAG: hypothetical protein U9N86_16260 [Bacteroidota bacterium]|nr:hypothetical protein [Bacteroidota bacterium]